MTFNCNIERFVKDVNTFSLPMTCSLSYGFADNSLSSLLSDNHFVYMITMISGRMSIIKSSSAFSNKTKVTTRVV